MSEIPDDIIEAGHLEAERYARWLHTMKTKGSLSPRAIDGLADTFSRIIFSERLRNAEIMEEVRKGIVDLIELISKISPEYEHSTIVSNAAAAIRCLSDSTSTPLQEQNANMGKEG